MHDVIHVFIKLMRSFNSYKRLFVFYVCIYCLYFMLVFIACILCLYLLLSTSNAAFFHHNYANVLNETSESTPAGIPRKMLYKICAIFYQTP